MVVGSGIIKILACVIGSTIISSFDKKMGAFSAKIKQAFYLGIL
jgi:hypothetical protein